MIKIEKFDSKIEEEEIANKIIDEIKEKDTHCFGSRFAPNIILYDKNDEVLDEIDTLHFANVRLVKGLFKKKILIDCRTQIFHGKFIKYIMDNNGVYVSKATIEPIVRDLLGRDFLLRIHINKLKLKDCSICCDESDKIYNLNFTLEINDIRKIDYELTEYIN